MFVRKTCKSREMEKLREKNVYESQEMPKVNQVSVDRFRVEVNLRSEVNKSRIST